MNSFAEFFLRNAGAERRNLLTSFNITAINVALISNMHLAFVKPDGAFKLHVSPHRLPVKNFRHAEVYDLSSKLRAWQQQGNPGKLDIEFRVSRFGRMYLKKFLKKWNKVVSSDNDWMKSGPMFLVVYYNRSLNGANSVISSIPIPAWMENVQKIRGGTPPSCKLYSFTTSFMQLGLSGVFLQPKSTINLFACYGRCSIHRSVDSRASYMSTHAWLLEHARRVLPISSASKQNLESCCVPIRYQGMRVLKRLPGGSIVSNLIPDMTASACGCR